MELIALLARGGAVSPKGEYINLEACHQVNKLRQLGGIHARNRIHNGDPNTCTLKASNRTQRLVKRAGLAEVIVRLLEPIERELVFAAPQLFHADTGLIG